MNANKYHLLLKGLLYQTYYNMQCDPQIPTDTVVKCLHCGVQDKNANTWY